MNKKVVAGAAAAGLMIAGCGGGGGAYDPNISWSAADQGTFDGACTANAPESYCHCALAALAATSPDPSSIGGAFNAGTQAGQDQSQFTACANGGGTQ